MPRQNAPFAPPLTRRLQLIAGTAVAVVLIGWAADARQQPQPQQQQTGTEQQPPQQAPAAPANTPTGKLPPLPLGQESVREVQSQLIALGFDPGLADGTAGPATLGAAQQYNESRGGTGPVPVDGALLARLQQDNGPRLKPRRPPRARSRATRPRRRPPPTRSPEWCSRSTRSLENLSNGGY